jgi:hypothetical protein
VDVTNIVKWREKKNAFEKRRGEVNLHYLYGSGCKSLKDFQV